MKNAERPSWAQSFSKLFLVYASYWYMVGPAFPLTLQLYINYRFGLIRLIGDATYPDVICVFSCLILVGYVVSTFVFSFRTRKNGIALISTLCGIAAMVSTELMGILEMPVGIWAITSMLLFSFFFMSHLLLWFEIFACKDSILNLIYILLLTAFAGCLCWFLIGLTGPRLICSLILLVIFAAVTLFKGFRDTAELYAPQPD